MQKETTIADVDGRASFDADEAASAMGGVLSPPATPSKMPTNGIDEPDVQEQANQFQMHMESMIRRSSDDLQRTLQLLYYEYHDFKPGQAHVCKPAEAEVVELEAVRVHCREVDPGQSSHTTAASAKPTLLNGASAKPASDAPERQTSGLRKSMSKSSLSHHESTEFEEHLVRGKTELLVKALTTAESVEAAILEGAGKQRFTFGDMGVRELFLEPCMGFVIILNVGLMGVVMDFDADSGFTRGIDVTFCFMFCLEFAVQITFTGCKHHFCGKDAPFNWFSAFLVVFDVLGITMQFNGIDSRWSTDASLLRAVRVMRLTRLLRVLNLDVFADLNAMMQDMMSGMSTLGWSMVLFFCIIYVFALVFREALGRDDSHEVAYMFNSVPRSIYTTVRCSFGDCSSPTGVPIFEYVQTHHGWFWSVVYCVFVYLITIGLFNVISAVFVEATMTSAAAMDLKTKQERLANEDLWSVQVASLLRRLVRRHPPEPYLLFTCSWEECCCVSLQERLREAGTGMPDAEWAERLILTDNLGKPVDCLAAIPESAFPITAKLQAPSSMRVSDDAKHAADWADNETPLTEEFDHIAKLAYGTKSIDKWVQDPHVKRALDALDIDAQDHSRLSDILDPQNDGQVPILDLIDGIRRLRGFPRRSDIVCIDLMIRESQKMGHEQTKDIENVLKGTQECQAGMEEMKEQLQRIEAAVWTTAGQGDPSTDSRSVPTQDIENVLTGTQECQAGMEEMKEQLHRIEAAVWTTAGFTQP